MNLEQISEVSLIPHTLLISSYSSSTKLLKLTGDKKKKNQALLMNAMSGSQAKEMKQNFKKVSKLASLQKPVQDLPSMIHLTVTNPAASK